MVYRYAKGATLLRGALRLLAARLAGNNACSSVTLLLTLRCNCACAYCDFPRNDRGRELGASEMIGLMDSLRRGGTFRLGLSGGEPLLREDFGRIARHAAALGFTTSLVTNGIQLEDRAQEALVMDYVLCTVEGDEAINDRQRGSGAFKAALAGLAALRSRGHRRLGIICPVHGLNYRAVEEPLRAAEDLGARVFYQPVQIREGWRGESFSAVADREAVREVFGRIRAWKRRKRPVGNSTRYLDYLIDGSADRFVRDCYAGRYFFTVLPDGSLLPCCMVSWQSQGVACRAGEQVKAMLRMRRPSCGGCTILPYFENTSLLEPHLPTLLDALGW